MRRSGSRPCPRRLVSSSSTRESCRSSTPCPGSKSHSPGTFSAFSSRGRRAEPQEDRHPESTRRPPANPAHGLEPLAGPGEPGTAPIPFLSVSRRPGSSTRSLNFLGTNDHPGDYRSSGCTACHVIYANDRSPVNSGPYARFGNGGLSFQADPTIPSNEPGHPIEHKFAVGIPTQPVHRLPCSSRHQRAQLIHRLHVVG